MFCDDSKYYHFLNVFCRRNRGESRLIYKKLKRQLNRRKNKKYPKWPKTHAATRDALNDPKFAKEFGRTADGYDNFYSGSVVKEEHSFHVFVSPSVTNLIKYHMIGQRRHYLIDGTFAVVPREFAQLLIISIEFKNDVSLFYSIFE